MEAREQWKIEEQEAMERENQRILDFARQQEEREKGRMAERKAEEEFKERVRSQLATELERKNQKEKELQQYVIFNVVDLKYIGHRNINIGATLQLKTII